MDEESLDTYQPIINKIILYGVLDADNLNLSHILRNQIKVGILKSYTFNQKTHQVQDSTNSEEDKYQIWVYPDGIKIYDGNYNIINDPEPEFSFFQSNIIHPQKILGNNSSFQNVEGPQDSIYSFVMTDYDLNRTYCTCLVWNQKKFINNDKSENQNQNFLKNDRAINPEQKMRRRVINQNSKILPKCTLDELIKDPLVLDPTTSLTYIPKGMILCSKHSVLKFQKDMTMFLYMNAIKKIQEATIKKDRMDELKNLIIKVGYPQAQKLYDREEFMSQEEQFQKQKTKEMPKPIKIRSKKTYERLQRQEIQKNFSLSNLRGLQKKKLEEFYLSFAFLPELIQSPDNEEKKIQILRVEDSINSSCKLDKVYFSDTCFKIPNFAIIETIQKIGIQNILILWKNAFLQKQILVFSSDQYSTIQLFETILYLLEPFKWENIYIPFLPFHLSEQVEALGGYLIGMSKIHMNYMIEHHNLQSKIFVDLDQLIIIEESGQNKIELPAEIQKWILQNLEKIGIKRKSANNESKLSWGLNLSKYIGLESQNSQVIQDSQESNQKKAEIIFTIKKIFFIALFYLVNNYSSYITLENKGVRFSREEYLTIFKDDSQKIFASEVIRTMMFVRICEFHKNAQKELKWNQDDLCSLFVYCHYIMKQDKGENTYWPINDNESESNSHDNKIENPIKYINFVVNKNLKDIFGIYACLKIYKVEHYLVKYLNYLNYKKPGIVKRQQKKVTGDQGWFSWLLDLMRKEQIQIYQSDQKKKQKLNKSHDFWNGSKRIIDLKKLFHIIGYEIGSVILQSLSHRAMIKKLDEANKKAISLIDIPDNKNQE